MIGLCDCNNFFVSCQRLFRPDLNRKPVAVLSGNDGCVIARSNEVKALGIKMGVPLFQVKEIVKNNDVVLFSANHHLYSDISQRVMATLKANTQGIEIYSVDEAFIDFSGFDLSTLKKHGEELAALTKQHTGIPVSIGIAPTKTLAKLASRLCKSYPALNGCCLMYREEDIEKVLKKTPIEDIWGIGRRTAIKLHAAGIETAHDFVRTPASWVKGQMHLPGLNTWHELQGVPMINITKSVDAAQSISIGRSFPKDISSIDELHSIVTSFATTVAAKLRAQGSCTAQLTTYLQTNIHHQDMPQHSEADEVRLEIPTDSTLEIVQTVVASLNKIYRRGYAYKKAGIICSSLVGKDHVQGSLFDEIDRGKHSKLMTAIDNINARLGRNSIKLAAENNKPRKQGEFLSNTFTTDWDEIPTVKK